MLLPIDGHFEFVRSRRLPKIIKAFCDYTQKLLFVSYLTLFEQRPNWTSWVERAVLKNSAILIVRTRSPNAITYCLLVSPSLALVYVSNLNQFCFWLQFKWHATSVRCRLTLVTKYCKYTYIYTFFIIYFNHMCVVCVRMLVRVVFLNIHCVFEMYLNQNICLWPMLYKISSIAVGSTISKCLQWEKSCHWKEEACVRVVKSVLQFI